MPNTNCDHSEHETPVPAVHMVDIAWTRGGGNTTRYMCDEHATGMEGQAIGSRLYRRVTTWPLHFHVVGVKGYHPLNVWERRPDGLYDHSGSAYAFTDDEVQACGAVHGIGA